MMTHIAPADLRAQKLAQAAKAIATVLQEEFQSVFRVLDTTTATLLWPQISSPTERAVVALTDVEEFRQLAQSHQVQVTVLPQGDFRLRLPMSLSGGITLIAEGVIKALATTASGAADEQTRLQRWAQAVLERLGQADQLRTRRFAEDELKLQLKTAWELNLTVDRLLRHLRIHRDMTTNLDQILKAALPFVGAQALIWVPQKLDGVVTCGEPVLSDDDARDLAKALRKSTDLRDTGLLLCKDGEQAAWGSSAAKLASLMVMIVPSSQTFGWLIAVNKSRNGAAENFRNSDAASMAPFAGLIGFLIRASDRYHDLKELLVGLTRSLASAVDAKDPYTYGHSERVARIAIELGRELSLSDDELSDLYLAGLLHDVGKIGIRDEVLCKHGPLTDEERQHINQHPVIGHSILKDLRQISSLLPGVLHHHERWDGAGYPTGLAGETIPRLARILAVADSYDAMSTSRPYRKAMSLAKVEQILTDGAGTQWDPRVIEAFENTKVRLRSIRERGLGESLRQALDGALRDIGSSRVLNRNAVPRTGVL